MEATPVWRILTDYDYLPDPDQPRVVSRSGGDPGSGPKQLGTARFLFSRTIRLLVQVNGHGIASISA